MTEIKIYTTDKTLLDDLNAAGIEGITADYRPEMAFDTGAETIVTIVVTAVVTKGVGLFGDWLLARLKSSSPPTQLTINNQTVNTGNVVTIINNIESKAEKRSDTRASDPPE